MTDDTQIYRMLGELTAKVDRLIKDQEEASKRREAMANDVSSLKGDIEDMHPKLAKAVQAAEELDGIKKMGKGYIAGALVSGGIAGGGIALWIADHFKAVFSLMKT